MTDPTPTQPPDPTAATGDAAKPPSFEERMDDFGRRAEAAGERWGKQSEAAGERWSKDPTVIRTAESAGRVWGLLVLAVGLWFFADITLGLDMPRISWRELWPVALIIVGLVVVFRGFTRNRA